MSFLRLYSNMLQSLVMLNGVLTGCRFSISKWIHLNSGDEGIIQFFNRVYSVLHPGGTFVLEPQEWETYSKAKRMDAVCIKIYVTTCKLSY